MRATGHESEIVYYFAFIDGKQVGHDGSYGTIWDAKFEVTVHENDNACYIHSRDAEKYEKRLSLAPPSKWHREKVVHGKHEGELAVFKADNFENMSYETLADGARQYRFSSVDYMLLNKNEQTLIFRFIPDINRCSVTADVALHGNNPSKEDRELARKVALSFRYMD
ncbi:hypothetical protein ACFL6Y_11535 [Elusimicrobiota bacterium]